jgi:long-subunit acyl-CoA synthetase (AMP-forming)
VVVFRKVRTLLGGRFRVAFSAAGGLPADLCKVFMAMEEYERIRRYAILDRRLSEARGELTPTLKVKRNAVIQHFGKEIEELYRRIGA